MPKRLRLIMNTHGCWRRSRILELQCWSWSGWAEGTGLPTMHMGVEGHSEPWGIRKPRGTEESGRRWKRWGKCQSLSHVEESLRTVACQAPLCQVEFPRQQCWRRYQDTNSLDLLRMEGEDGKRQDVKGEGTVTDSSHACELPKWC